MPGTSRVRVVVVLSSLRAEGGPRLVLALCRVWIKKGIEPIIVTLNPTPTDLAPDFAVLGVTIGSLNFGYRGYLRYVRLIIASFRLARRFRPTAVLLIPLGWHAFIAWGAKLARVPRVAAHVGTYPWHWKGLPFRKFKLEVQLGSPVTDCLICCSNYVQSGVLAWFGVDASRTLVVYNGVWMNRLAASTTTVKPILHRSSWILGMVGRLDHTKDYKTLILACHALKERGRPVELWLIGDGAGRTELESVVARSGLREHVHFFGVRRDIPELLSGLDIFVYSAKREEGLGIALIEAMAAGVPVVASDVGACREVLDGGELGLLVPPRDPAALAAAIERVRAEPEAAAARARRAQRRAFEVFDANRMAEAYAEVLGLKAAAGPHGEAA